MEVPGKKLQAEPSTADLTYCQPCEQDDEIHPAEAFCTVCKEFFCAKCASLHRKQKISRCHTLLDKSNMPTSIREQEDDYECAEPCVIHPKEFIKYFCQTHQTLICGHCAVQKHRSCQADVISDVSKAYKDGQEYRDIIEKIAESFINIDLGASDVEKNVEVVAKLGENEIYKLRKFREEVNKYFEERELALLKLIEKTKHKDEELLRSLKPKYTNLKSRLEEINATLKAQESNMIQLFIETKRAKKLLEGLQNDFADINKENVIHHYEFRNDPATERLIASGTGIGTIENIMTVASESEENMAVLTVQEECLRETMATSEFEAPSDIIRHQLTPAAYLLLPVESQSDIDDCYLPSMLHLAGSRLLLADFNNHTVKLVDMQTNSLVSQISVSGNPWDMCHLPGDRVAVSMATKGIQFLDTLRHLALGDRIKVGGDCRGIAYHEDTLIVSFYNGKIAVLNMNGQCTKS